MSFGIDDVEEVTVTLKNGQKIAFRGRGVEKLRKLMATSPPMGASTTTIHVVEGSDDEVPVKSSKKGGKKKHHAPLSAGGYSTVSLEYKNGGADAMNAAKELQRQAEMSGIKFV